MPDIDQALVGFARELRRLRDQKDDLTAELKEINKGIQNIEELKLPDKMKAMEIDKFSVINVGMIRLISDVRAYIKVDDKDEAFTWLEQIGCADIIKRTIHPQTLVAFVRERLESNLSVHKVFGATPYDKAKLRRS